MPATSRSFDITIVSPASGVVAGLPGVYARVTLAGADRDGQIYSAAGYTVWEAIANAFDSYVRRVILRLRPNGAPLDDWGPDPFPPPRSLAALDLAAAAGGRNHGDEADPIAGAMRGLPLWSER